MSEFSPEFGMIYFDIEKETTLKKYVRLTCRRHGIPESIVDQFDTPRETVDYIHDLCKKGNIDLRLNRNTRNKNDFENKVASVILEEVVGNMWGEILSKPKSELYDWLINGKIRLDVKSKTRKAIPRLWYDVTLEDYMSERKNDCDFYLFGQVNRNLKEGYVLGIISSEDFWKKAKHRPVKLPDGKITEDQHVLKIKDLNQWGTIEEARLLLPKK